MIPPRAIAKFLDRPLFDSRTFKQHCAEKIDDHLDQLGAFPFEKMMLHQKVCLYLGLMKGSFAFWCDMGTGKTLIALELLQYWWENQQLRRALVFVTSDKAFSTWERQADEFKISVPFISLDSSTSEGKWKLLEQFDQGIIFLHYPGTAAMVCEKVKRKKKNELVIVPEKLERLLHQVDAVVLDESTKCGNQQSLTYEICEAAARQAKFRYALAGMPFGRDPALLWPQMKLVDGGETLGATLGLFREAFFTKKKNYWGGPYSFDYTFKTSLKTKLADMLQNRSITYTAAECIELPDVVHVKEEVILKPEVLEFYHRLVTDMIGAQGNMRTVQNTFLRMRQLSSGFLGLKDDETGDKAEMDFDENPKLERLLDLIEALPRDSKALIFYDYTHSGRLITEALSEELNLALVWLWSGTKNSAEALRRFSTEPTCRVAVLNNRVGAYSLDGLQVANYEFHFESAVSVIDRAQAEKRIVRKGQTRKCFIYDLVARNTVDAKILQFHREGYDLFAALRQDPTAVLT